MKLPTKIRITSKVSYDVFLVDPEQIEGDWGLCDAERQFILINKTLAPLRMRETFIHEVLHALEFEYGIPIKHSVVEQLDHAIERLFFLNGVKL